MNRLTRLDDEQWRVVDLLLALTPQDLRTLEAVVSSEPGDRATHRSSRPR